MALPDAATLRELYEDAGMSVRAIARQAGCRPQTVFAAMDAAGIARRRPGRRRTRLPDWDRAKLRQLVAVQGLPYVRSFARQYGVSREKLSVLVGQRALPRGAAAASSIVAHDPAIRRAYDRGARVKDLAAQYGCSVRAISSSLDRTSGNQSEANAEQSALASDWFPEAAPR